MWDILGRLTNYLRYLRFLFVFKGPRRACSSRHWNVVFFKEVDAAQSEAKPFFLRKERYIHAWRDAGPERRLDQVLYSLHLGSSFENRAVYPPRCVSRVAGILLAPARAGT